MALAIMTKADPEASKALTDLNNAYRDVDPDAPTESQIGWEHLETFREAMRRPVKTADPAGAALIAKALGNAIRGGKPN